MKLTYRGISYNTAPTSITTVDSGVTAQYRGVLYTLLRATDAPVMPVQTLMYRGATVGASDFSWHPEFRPATA